MIHHNCPNPACQAPMLFQDNAAGRAVICQACKTQCTVPPVEVDGVLLTKTEQPSQAPTYRVSTTTKIFSALLFLVGMFLLAAGMVRPSSEYGSKTVNLDLLFIKLINVVVGGSLLVTGALLGVMAEVRELKIVDPPNRRR